MFRVINPRGLPVGSLVHAEDCAVLMAFYGAGARILSPSGRVLWHEGYEAQPAEESYDHVTEIVHERYRNNAAAAGASRG